MIKLTNSQFAERTFYSESGKKINFHNGREYLIPIYDTPTRKLVLYTSRQSEKSTLLANRMLTRSFLIDGNSSLYVNASIIQVKDFSNKKIKKQFVYNKALSQLYLKGPNVVNNVFDKQFSNGSTISFRQSGEDGERARGITARDIYFDETQSINSDAIANIMESASTFHDATYLFAGTPLSEDNYLAQLYKSSKQYEWIIKCKHCGRWQEPLGIQHIDVKKPYLFCQYCGKEIDASYGTWVSFNEDGIYPGFRIVRLMVPWAQWRTDAADGILDKFESYPRHRFLNEVLAIETESAMRIITEAQLRACAHPDFNMTTSPNLTGLGDTFAGLDWAMEYKDGSTSFTELGVFAYQAGRLKLVFAKRYDGDIANDSDAIISDIAKWMRVFNVRFLGADYGVGHKENMRLKKIFPDRVVEFQYVPFNDATVIKWDAQSMKYEVNRTRSLEDVFSRIEKKWYWFPTWEEFKPFAKDIMAEFAEYDTTNRKMRYDHKQNEPDDFLHVLNYATMVAKLYYRFQ